MSGHFGDKKLSPGAPDPRGTAARRLAVESLINIAGASVGEAPSSAANDPEVGAIVELLKSVDRPVAVADVAERLKWDSERAAQALARGGDGGVLTFIRSGASTFVGLSTASAA
jgi:hypothetical protein